MTRPSSQEASAGGVLVRRAAGGRGFEVCLIRRLRHQQSAWSFPKGHLEPDEDARAAALREVLEETGRRAEVLDVLPTITYQFARPPEQLTVSKSVAWFLMRPTDEPARPYDAAEVVDVRWVMLQDAAVLLAHDNERQLLAAVGRLLNRPEVASQVDG